MMNKRDFLASAATVLIAPGALALGSAGEHAGGPVMNAQSWQSCLQHDFVLLDCPGQPIVRLDAIQHTAPNGVTEQFSLRFSGAEVPAGLHRLGHASGRDVTLYLATAGSAREPLLRADFNLL